MELVIHRDKLESSTEREKGRSGAEKNILREKVKPKPEGNCGVGMLKKMKEEEINERSEAC